MNITLVSPKLDMVVLTGDNLLNVADHLERGELSASLLLDLVLKVKEFIIAFLNLPDTSETSFDPWSIIFVAVHSIEF